MDSRNFQFQPKIPKLRLAESAEMLTDFSREAQRHLMSARNSLLVLETVSNDKDAIENIFKTFHTIKGLADFLNLEDICHLTTEAEILMDKVRKNILAFEDNIVIYVSRSIDSLQKLLELLDEQIQNGGNLNSPYLNVTDLVQGIRALTSLQPYEGRVPQNPPKSLPTIDIPTDSLTYSQVEKHLNDSGNDLTLPAELVKKLMADYQETSNELRATQSKLQERQRDLIKERQLAIKLTQQAQAEARAKSEYLANMSHEIRTLINAILGFTDLLKNSSLNEKEKSHLNTIITSGNMLLEIVNHILDFSKVEAGKLKLEKINFNLDYIIEEVFKIIRSRLRGKPIHLFFHIAQDVPRNLIGDPTRLKQIFINLLDNAIKFTEDGEIGLDVQIDTEADGGVQQCGLKFCLSDTGIGITEDRKKSIFESFTQADESTTRIYGGTGLGLALCKNFVEKMEGKIWVESELGKGCRFIFTAKFDQRLGAIPSSQSTSPLSIRADALVLIVDSNKKSALTLQSFFQKSRFSVLPILSTAKDAFELLTQLEREGRPLPQIMFIDAMLPNKDGFMLAFKIRQKENFRKIKLVALSSDIKIDGTNEFRQAGFQIYLPKPIIKSELEETLRMILGSQTIKAQHMSSEMLDNASTEGLRVLVVEDSLPNQELLKVHLESLGCICDYVSNGQEAIENLRAKKYNIVFMDLQMPILNGLEATKIIRDNVDKTVPIVALTAAEVQSEREKCLEAGMNDYLSKPFGVNELKMKIIECAKT